MSVLEEYQYTKPVWIEGFLAILFGVMLVSSLTITDINFFDDYVLLIMSWCYEDNQDDFCQNFREKHGLGITEQIGIGDKYWKFLEFQAIMLFVLMFTIRMGFAFYLQSSHIRKVKPTSVLMAIIWGASGTVLFLFGALDHAYYLFQEEGVPDQLPWLDGVGVFEETKTWFGDPEHVDKMDLYVTNIVGLGILILLLLFEVMLFSALKYKHRGIA